jgi:hypothetical protein
MGCCDAQARAVSVSHIDGTPTYFWRGGSTQRTTFSYQSGFHARCVAWIRDLRALSARYGDSAGYDRLQYLVLAGVYFCRNDGCFSWHNFGRALDLDRVYWSSTIRCDPYYQDHVDPSRRVRRRYLAVQAVSRRHFRYVLDGYYDAAHRDHMHLDDSALPLVCDTTSRSGTVFVQQCCREFLGSSLAISGVWDSATEAAFRQSRRALGISSDPKFTETGWRAWCARAAAHGFADTAFGTTAWPPA